MQSFVGANKVYCGGCANGELAGRYSGHYIPPGSCITPEDNTNDPTIVIVKIKKAMLGAGVIF